MNDIRQRFHNLSLLARTLVRSALTIGCSVLLLTLLFLAMQHAAFREQLELRASNLADFVASQVQFAMLVGDRAEMSRVAASALSGEDVLSVAIADHAGGQPIRASRQYHGGEAVVARRLVVRPASDGLADWADATASPTALGSVEVGISTQKQNALFHRGVRMALLVAVIYLAFVLSLQYAQTRRLLGPLVNLIAFTRSVASGDLSRRAPVARLDEVGQLTQAFNHMIDRLDSTMVSQDYVQAIIRSLSESLIVIDTEMRIRTVNEATAALLGSGEQELLGSPSSQVLHDFDPAAPHAAGEECVYHARHGREIPVLFSASALRDNEGRVQGHVWLAQDITERKRVQRELLEAKEAAEAASLAKSQFLANMTHELRTPLNAVLGYCELLQIEMVERNVTDWADDLKKIERSATHLLSLINNVLDLSRIESGRLELEAGEFDLASIIEDVSANVLPLAAKNGNRLNAHCLPAPMYGDATRVRQCLVNLVANACKFTHNGLVSVDVVAESREEETWYTIHVRDTGIGITPEQLEKLFASFTQADTSTTRKYGGSGLGLAISRRLCRLMGGDIKVRSVPGQGSVFSLSLPAGRVPESGQAGSDPVQGAIVRA